MSQPAMLCFLRSSLISHTYSPAPSSLFDDAHAIYMLTGLYLIKPSQQYIMPWVQRWTMWVLAVFCFYYLYRCATTC